MARGAESQPPGTPQVRKVSLPYKAHLWRSKGSRCTQRLPSCTFGPSWSSLVGAQVSESAGRTISLGQLYVSVHGAGGIPSDVPAFDEYDSAADAFLASPETVAAGGEAANCSSPPPATPC
jgi:hypothetical protein